MKSTLLSITLLASLLATIITHSQTTPDVEDPFAADVATDLPSQMIRVHAEFIEMPHATYTALMAKPRHSTNDTDLRKKCAQLIASKDARMIESLCITANPGQTATSESVAEYIYPTDAEPPIVPNQISPTKSDSGSTKPPRPQFISAPPNPTAYETRNTGATLELEAHIDANSPIIELRLTPTISYLTEKVVWSTWTNQETSVDISTPLFYTLRTKTGATVVAGETHMTSAHSPQNDKGFMDPSRKIMLFVRADIISSEK